MPELKLQKLPDRTPVKMTIQISPDLAQSLQDYATVYAAQYGQAEEVAALVPHMLAGFIESDSGFQAALRAQAK